MYDPYDYSWDSSRRAVQQSINRINELESKGVRVTAKEAKELQELIRDLDKYRETCSHSWAKIVLFVTVKRMCVTCRKEDKTYDYFTDKDYDRPKL